MVKRRRTELPGEGESSEPRGSGARQGEPQHLPEQLLRYPGKSSCQQQGRGGQPNPVSTKPLRLPLRPGRGSIGTPIHVKANHFLADLSYKDLHQYDVSVIDRALLIVIRIMGAWVQICFDVYYLYKFSLLIVLFKK